MPRGQFNKLNPTHFDFGATSRKAWGESSFNRLVRQYKANAVKRSLVFELTNEAVRQLTSADCSYCGSPPSSVLTDKESYGSYTYTGIDRKDPLQGYVLTNVVSCCKVCNRAKSNMPYDDWIAWLIQLKDYRS